MTPKEKAVELVEKFKPCAADYEYDFIVELGNAKICALIAVDEMIKLNGDLYLQVGLNEIAIAHYKKTNGYLFEVKTEINNL